MQFCFPFLPNKLVENIVSKYYHNIFYNGWDPKLLMISNKVESVIGIHIRINKNLSNLTIVNNIVYVVIVVFPLVAFVILNWDKKKRQRKQLVYFFFFRESSN